MGPLEGVRVLEAGLLVQGPQAVADHAGVGRRGHQDRVARIRRPEPMAPHRPPGSPIGVLHGVQPRQTKHDDRPPRAKRTRGLPPPGGGRRRRHHQLQARHHGCMGARLHRGRRPQRPDHLCDGLLLRARGSRRRSRRGGPQRPGGRWADQHDGWQGRGSRAPIGATIADHIAGQNLLSGILAALYAREHTGRGQLVETSLLGGQVWAQAGEYTRYLLSGEVSGPSGRSHPMIPGIYGVFPTADGWIAIVGTAGPARDVFYRTIGRPDLIERFPTLLYFEEDKAALWPILDEVFATKPTAEWCTLLGAAGLRFAPVRDHAEVAADAGVRANGYIAPGSRHPTRRERLRRGQSSGAILGTHTGGGARHTRAGATHRGGAARVRLLLGRHRRALGGRRHLGARLRSRTRSAPLRE